VEQGDVAASHLNPKKFAGELTAIDGWPTHAMTGLKGPSLPTPQHRKQACAPRRLGPKPDIDVLDPENKSTHYLLVLTARAG
jgi:hypothetical protein